MGDKDRSTHEHTLSGYFQTADAARTPKTPESILGTKFSATFTIPQDIEPGASGGKIVVTIKIKVMRLKPQQQK